MKKTFYMRISRFQVSFSLHLVRRMKLEGTATQDMAGEWYVTAAAVDASGNVVDPDFFGLGHFHLDTYNTSSNSKTEMWIDDNGNFWEFKNKINVDLKAMTFQATDAQTSI